MNDLFRSRLGHALCSMKLAFNPLLKIRLTQCYTRRGLQFSLGTLDTHLSAGELEDHVEVRVPLLGCKGSTDRIPMMSSTIPMAVRQLWLRPCYRCGQLSSNWNARIHTLCNWLAWCLGITTGPLGSPAALGLACHRNCYQESKRSRNTMFSHMPSAVFSCRRETALLGSRLRVKLEAFRTRGRYRVLSLVVHMSAVCRVFLRNRSLPGSLQES